MALTLDFQTTESVTLPEALAIVENGRDRCSFDELIEKTWVLKALANNRTFLRDLLNADIHRALDGKATSIYSPQSVGLGSASSVTFRANFWFVPSSDIHRQKFESSLYSYGTAHDHNFNFSTVGYLGPGYQTDIHEYDRSAVSGYAGGKVAIEHLESTTLSEGKVMAFRSGRDVHTQLSPVDFSISINMMARDANEETNPQFFFDLKEGRITSLLDNHFAGKLALIRIAQHLGDDETRGLLKGFTDRRFSPFVRAAAYSALINNSSGEGETKLRFEIGNDDDGSLERRVAAVDGIMA